MFGGLYLKVTPSADIVVVLPPAIFRELLYAAIGA